MNFLNAASALNNQFNSASGSGNQNASGASPGIANISNLVNLLGGDSTSNEQQNNTKNEAGKTPGVTGNISNLVNLLGGDNTSNEQQNNTKNEGGKTAGGTGFDFSQLGSLLGMVPQAEEKKSKLIGVITPIVKVMSPKWGDVIVGILKNLDLEKLLAVTKNEEELEKKVRQEEERLERQKQ